MKPLLTLLLLTFILLANIPQSHGNSLLSDGSHTFLTDALGSTRGLADRAGQLTDSYDYSPYGTLLRHSGSSDNPFLFTGEQYDPEAGLYYLRARYYSPELARFLSRDTYEGTLTDPLSQNPYLYARGNPAVYVDPSGHFFGGFIGLSLSFISELWGAYPRIAGTVEQGAIVSMYARAVVLGMEMRNEALASIIQSIMIEGISRNTIDYAYKKYSYATHYLGMVTGNVYDVYQSIGWMQATLGFAKGLMKIPAARYTSIPERYLLKTNSLNKKVILRIDKVVKDKIGFEEALEIVKDMTKLIWKIGREFSK